MEFLNFNLSTKEAEYILAIVSEGSLTKAARKLYITQPSLTQALQKLEKQFDVKLFLREGHQITPTYAGEKLAAVCAGLVKSCRDMSNELDEIQKKNQGNVIVGMPFNLSAYMFPHLYRIYQQLYPGIRVIPMEGTSIELENMLLSGHIDIAVIMLPCKNKALKAEKIFEAKMILSVPSGHWLNQQAKQVPGSRHPQIDLKLADGEPFILSPADQKVRLAEEELFRHARITPKTVFVTKNVETKKRMSAAGLGLSIFPEHYLEFYSSTPGASYYYIDSPRPDFWTVGAIYQKDAYISQATSECLAILTKLFENYEPYSLNPDITL